MARGEWASGARSHDTREGPRRSWMTRPLLACCPPCSANWAGPPAASASSSGRSGGTPASGGSARRMAGPSSTRKPVRRWTESTSRSATPGPWGLPVPRVLAAVQRGGRLGMVMTDLGEPDRDATDADAAEIAAALHRCPGSDALPLTGAAELSVMPQRIAVRALDCGMPPEAAAMAGRLAAQARRLAAPAEDPPFGLVHSEWHPSSMIVRDGRRYTYDLARAFRGPGLIDLASWHGTITPADPAATARRPAARGMGTRLAPDMGRRLVLPATGDGLDRQRPPPRLRRGDHPPPGRGHLATARVTVGTGAHAGARVRRAP